MLTAVHVTEVFVPSKKEEFEGGEHVFDSSAKSADAVAAYVAVTYTPACRRTYIHRHHRPKHKSPARFFWVFIATGYWRAPLCARLSLGRRVTWVMPES